MTRKRKWLPRHPGKGGNSTPLAFKKGTVKRSKKGLGHAYRVRGERKLHLTAPSQELRCSSKWFGGRGIELTQVIGRRRKTGSKDNSRSKEMTSKSGQYTSGEEGRIDGAPKMCGTTLTITGGRARVTNISGETNNRLHKGEKMYCNRRSTILTET